MKWQNYALVLGRVVWRQDRVICRLSDGKKKRKRKGRQKRFRQIEKNFQFWCLKKYNEAGALLRILTNFTAA